MNQLPTSSSINPVNPLDLIRSELFIFRQRIQTDSLIVEHSIQTPNAIEFSDTDYHILGVHLSPGIRQVARIGEQKYDGAIDTDSCLLHPANYPAFYSRYSTDECAVFLIEPQYLTRIAATSECLNPDLIELNPFILGYDRALAQITRSFVYEMQNEALGGKLYFETLATQLAIHLAASLLYFYSQTQTL